MATSNLNLFLKLDSQDSVALNLCSTHRTICSRLRIIDHVPRVFELTLTAVWIMDRNSCSVTNLFTQLCFKYASHGSCASGIVLSTNLAIKHFEYQYISCTILRSREARLKFTVSMIVSFSIQTFLSINRIENVSSRYSRHNTGCACTYRHHRWMLSTKAVE